MTHFWPHAVFYLLAGIGSIFTILHFILGGILRAKTMNTIKVVTKLILFINLFVANFRSLRKMFWHVTFINDYKTCFWEHTAQCVHTCNVQTALNELLLTAERETCWVNVQRWRAMSSSSWSSAAGAGSATWQRMMCSRHRHIFVSSLTERTVLSMSCPTTFPPNVAVCSSSIS